MVFRVQTAHKMKHMSEYTHKNCRNVLRRPLHLCYTDITKFEGGIDVCVIKSSAHHCPLSSVM